MKEFQNLSWAFTGTALLALLSSSIAQPQTQPAQENQQPASSRMDRPLRISVTVDDQSFLQVKEGEQIREGNSVYVNQRQLCHNL